MKIIAFYLPQFHTFPENDAWWGKGFTEWTSVKGAVPLFQGHNQPRVPYRNNYYDLTREETVIWQSHLAEQYGIYGFCYYHYWFDGKMLMNQPMEIMLQCKAVKTKFCICWANENWTRQWAAKNKEILIGQTYGSEDDWEKHFLYLLPFLKDERYIKIDHKPIIIIYRPAIIPTLREMMTMWNKLALENGLEGIYWGYQHPKYSHINDKNGDLFDFGIEYQPTLAKAQQLKEPKWVIRKFLNIASNKLHFKPARWNSTALDYDDVWHKILNREPVDAKMFPGAFVDWDSSPRYKNRSSFYMNVTPSKFQMYLEKQIMHAVNSYHKDILFFFAWNEWGEGGYLEPDEKYGFGMLQAVKQALINTNQLE